MNLFFGPLSKEYCFYYLLLTYISFFILLTTLVYELYYLMFKLKKINSRVLVTVLMVILNLFIVYFVNRLSYTVCSKSLQ
jgi:hypothetical protein